MPAISVIMPVYNAAHYLDEAIKSILDQTFTDFEFLIFNDGSTDDSAAIVNSYEDPRIIFTDNPFNQGYIPLLNEGIRLSKGKYIARMDADDVSNKERFEMQYSFMEQHSDYVLCGTRYTSIPAGEKGELPLENDDIKLKMLYITPFCHPSVMFRSSVLNEHNLLYSAEHMPAEDHEMWVKLSHYGKYHNLKESLVNYRVHSNNISTKKRTDQQVRNLRHVQLDYLDFFFKNAKINREDILVLHDLFYKNHGWTIEQLARCGNLIQQITHSGTTFPVPSEKVYELLSSHLYYRCTISTNLGVYAFYIANRYSYGGVTLGNNFRLLAKALLKYNPNKSI